MGEIRVFYQDHFDDFVDNLNQGLSFDYASVLILDRPLHAKQEALIQSLHQVLCFALRSPHWDTKKWPPYVVGFLSNLEDGSEIQWALEEASRVLNLRHENEQLRLRVELEEHKRKEIMASALELSSERDLSKLCEKTLLKLRRLLDAEGASLFLFEPQSNSLRFQYVQNEKFNPLWESFRLPIDEESIAGAAAVRKEVIHLSNVYDIPKEERFRFNSSFDQKTGYRTRNLLTIPLLKTDGDLVGIVQVINSRRKPDFSSDEIELGRAFSAHIAVALETALLYRNIEDLFEGFVKASVTAIESRDPTTSGHSERVAQFTVRLAQEVHESDHKYFKAIRFNEHQYKELRYASLLHDFGKIGVPEKVLVKSKKLYPEELQEIQRRFLILRLAAPERRKEFEELWNSILKANEPSILVEEVRVNLEKYVGKDFEVENEILSLLSEEEWKRLSVKKGSLDSDERHQIESHVVHTKKFLENIPWTRDLSRVTEIASLHHERLNGKGYPFGYTEEKIPIESQIMAVADVFDALTAMDRPYKKAVPIDRALEILKMDAKDHALNPELVRLFCEKIGGQGTK